MEVAFDGSLPSVAPRVIREIRFSICRTSALRLRLECVVDDAIDDKGCFRDAWYSIVDPQLPTRQLRLMGGHASLNRLVTRYGLLDASGCLNSTKGVCVCVDPSSIGARCSINGNMLRKNMGVPQRLENSGICWYASVCFALFLNAQLRAYVVSKLPEDMRELARSALSNPASSEELRRQLWERFAFGDEIGQPPELDGQNGATQIAVLASQVDICLQRYMVDDEGRLHELPHTVWDQRRGPHALRSEPASGEPHLILFRFRHGMHADNPRHRPPRFFRRNGRTYRLVSMLMGSESCGHQIAASTPTSSWRDWAACDSDQRRYDIGPTCWRISPELIADRCCEATWKAWWGYFAAMFNVILLSGGVCNLSPHNLDDKKLLQVQSRRQCGYKDTESQAGGRVNLDVLYLG